MGRVKNEIGNRHGRLIAIKRNGVDKHGQAMWFCRCDCGNEKTIQGQAMRNGNTVSCGCYNREKNSLPTGECSFNGIFARMKLDAKKRNYKWDLTKEQVKILTKQNCYYCGMLPNQTGISKFPNGNYIYNGLDRTDNTKGYTIDNVVPCCIKCNHAKWTLGIEEFKLHIKKIYEYFVSK